MKWIKPVLIILFLSYGLIITGNPSDNEGFLKVKGPYLGQKPPGKTPEIFAPGIVSTDKGELNIIISPDGNEIYFSRSPSPHPTVIMVLKLVKGKWTLPRVASFSGKYSDMDPGMSPDGKYFFFTSRRTGNGDIYWVDAKVLEVFKNQ